MTKSNEAALHAALDAHFAKKPEVRLPHYSGPDFNSWQVEAHRDRHDLEATGFIIVDEYGEEIRGGGFWARKASAEAHLKVMIAEEIEAREEHGPEDGNPHTLPVE